MWPEAHSTLSALLFLGFAGTSIAQFDPVRDFCRRWAHQTAVVDRKLYLDGGLVNYKPFSSSSQNATNRFLAYHDLSTEEGGMPPLHADLKKNASIPNVGGGALWADSVNKRLYLYGGETLDSTPAPFNLYSYDIIYNEWVSFGAPQGVAAINAVSFGAGVSIPERGEAYYYGGWMSNSTVPGWGPTPLATNRLVKYTMDTNSWANLTGPDDTRRAEGVMVYLPVGDGGMLVYFGGGRDLYGNGTLTPQPMDEILLFDLANTKWYSQKTSGRTPEIRRRFCAGVTWAEDRSSFNVYLYGGAGFAPDTTGYDDIYILTMPSFQWIRAPYPPGSNVTGPYPKSMMSCDVVDNAQMIIIGGSYSNDTTYACDADVVWGAHNMNLGENNEAHAIWAEYQPDLTTYTVPPEIATVVGGGGTGGANIVAPTTGFDSPDLAVQMTRTPMIDPRTPTRAIPTATDSASSKPLSTGAIAGIAVGCGIAGIVLAAVFFICVYRWRKRRRMQRHPDASTVVSWDMNASNVSPMSIGGPQFYQEYQPPSELADSNYGVWARRGSQPGKSPAELSSPEITSAWQTYEGRRKGSVRSNIPQG